MPVCENAASMRTTVSLDDELAEHVDAVRPQDAESDAEAVRECVRRSQRVDELNGRVDELETEIEHKQARIDELNNKLAEAHSRIDTTNELVERVEGELTARERREQRERKKAEAGLLTRAKWSVFGMDLSKENEK